MNAENALSKLKTGNELFVSAVSDSKPLTNTVERAELAQEQRPFAIILGCSDSRVPPELIFGQAVGDLFVVRVAGNVATPSQLGSIEFACQKFGSQLVVVLGHQHCGAIGATVESLLNNADGLSPNIAAIVDNVSPAVSSIVETHWENREVLLQAAMRANVELSVQRLIENSETIRGLVEQQKLTIIGAEYSLESGEVAFYE